MSSRLWQEECFSAIPESNDLLKTWELLENKKNSVTILKDRLGIEIEHLSLQARLEEYATNLDEGKPCPLCGSLSHPLPLNSQNVKDKLLLVRQQSSDFDRLIRDIELNQKVVLYLPEFKLSHYENFFCVSGTILCYSESKCPGQSC